MEEEFIFSIEKISYDKNSLERTFENSFGKWNVMVTRSDSGLFNGYVVFQPTSKISESLLKKVKITLNFIHFESTLNKMDLPAVLIPFTSCYNFNFTSKNYFTYQIEIKIDASSLDLPDQTLMIYDHMKQMYESGNLADITIKTEDDKEIKAHNFILSRSKVFNAMLNAHDTMEAQKGVIVIEDIDYDVLVEMIRHLYTDEAQKVEEMALKLLIAANKYDIPGLEAECVDWLITNVAKESFAEILIVADQLNIQSLKVAVIDFVIVNRKTILQSDVWKNLKINHMHLAMEVIEKFILDN